jgi:hypothetical protein
MDDLLREFPTETGEHLDTVDRELADRRGVEARVPSARAEPLHMDPRSIHLSLGAHRLESRPRIILDVDAVLAPGAQPCAA